MVHACPDCLQTCYCDCDDSNDASAGECFHGCEESKDNDNDANYSMGNRLVPGLIFA